jgi:hypothetical protein
MILNYAKSHPSFAFCALSKPGKQKQLIETLATETSGAKLEAKCNYKPEHKKGM